MTTVIEATDQKPLHIVELRTENVKRLHAVTIRPNGAVVLIGGENAQGKSSLLDSIEMVLAGARAIPLEPIRHGARKARIVADLGEIVVERTFSAKGTQLVVKGKDGMELASPQKLLDGLCAKIAFDPFAFARMEAKQQDELLKKMLGLDFSDLEQARKKVYDLRADANKEIKRLEALLDSATHHADAPKEPVSVAELTAQLQEHGSQATQRAIVVAQVASLKANLEDFDARIKKLRSDLEQLEGERATLAGTIAEKEAALPPEPAPATELQERIRTAEATNAKVRTNAEYAKLEKDIVAKVAEADQCKDTIDSIDEEKAQRLSKAEFPVDGLGFDDAGPTFKGVPLAQASQAQKVILSAAIGAALAPRVKVMLIREGSLLGDNSLAELEAFAAKEGLQIWIERVGKKDPSAVIIEDGSVLEAVDMSAQNTGT